MYYVYVLKSLNYPDQIYIGFTANLKNRLVVHNSGGSPHTAKYKPWKLISYTALENQDKAIEFEDYLKSKSGRALIYKRFLQS